MNQNPDSAYWSEILAVETISTLLEEVAKSYSSFKHEVSTLGRDNIPTDLLEGVDLTLELEGDLLNDADGLKPWIEATVAANAKSPQEPSRDAELLSRVDEFVDTLEVTIGIIEAVLAQLRDPSGGPTEIQVPIDWLDTLE